MKTAKSFALTAFLLIGTFSLIAQGQKKTSNYEKMLNRFSNNYGNNNVINLGKKGAKLMLDSLTSVYWDTLTNKYSEDGTTLKYKYDANGNNYFQTVSLNFKQFGGSLDFLKVTNSFNSTNKMVLQTTITKDGNGNWSNNSKNEYTYDGSGNKTVLKQFNWDKTADNWILGMAKYFTYNSNNKVVTEIDSNFNGNEISINKVISTYDSSKNLMSEIRATWQNASFVNSSKTDYSYDANNKLTIYIISSYNENATVWVNSTKGLLSYDTNGNNNNTIKYSWNLNNNMWDVKEKDSILFNTAVLSKDIYWPTDFYDNGEIIKNQITTYTAQDYVNGNYRNNAFQTFYYSPYKATIGMKEITETNINIYPNPSNGMINLITNEAIENINITDVNGKLVHHQTNNSPIDLSANSKGIYFVNITTEKGVINKKIVLN
jgi:hypothetical protein